MGYYDDGHDGSIDSEASVERGTRVQASGARAKMVKGAADMLSRRGLNATTVRELAKHIGTPLGSTYHYFPGGKEQLVSEAVKWAGDELARSLTEYLKMGPVAGLEAFLLMWKDAVADSDFQAGCPVAAASVEFDESTPGRGAATVAAEVFASWERLLAESLTRDAGVEVETARQLATFVVATIEGAVMLCRANRSIGPLTDSSVQLLRMIRLATETSALPTETSAS